MLFGLQPPAPLSTEQVDRLDGEAMRILEEIGVEVRSADLCAALASLGQTVAGTRVRLDREFVRAQVALSPAAFDVRSRNPARTIRLGDGSTVLTPAGGAPFCSDLDRGRREGTLGDHDELVRLSHAATALGCLQSGMTEASDRSENTRHLDLDYSCARWSDKPYICYGTSGPKARDGALLAMIAAATTPEDGPVVVGIVNPNSPLVWDELMVDALVAWAELGQAIAMTPFLLAGATAPLGVASGLALQTAEALSGIVLAQVARPGTPCLFGSFYSSVDMRTGGPAFGTPDSVLATVAGVQLARRYDVPIRAGGGLCTGIALDGQAVAETLNSLWATFLAAPDLVLHAAGWMEGGLVTSYEKLAIDLELLRMFGDLRGGVPIDDEHLAFDSIREEGPGGIFLGSSHTYERFREWSFSSPLFRAQAYPNWQRQGSKTIVEHAHDAWKGLLAGYEDPGIDDAVDEELREFVERRQRDADE